MDIDMREDDYRDIEEIPRPAHRHLPMDIPHRAKQFAPFAALKGFEDTVYAKEIIWEDRMSLTPEKQAEIDRHLRELREGMTVTAVWFEEKAGMGGRGRYCTVTGPVTGTSARRSERTGGYSVCIAGTEIRAEDLAELSGDGFADNRVSEV